MTKINICPICVGVSSAWLLLSFGVVWGYLSASVFLIPIALLMGGTVVGISYLGERRCRWAAKHPQAWKALVILIGMPLAYLSVNNLTKVTIVVELFLLSVIAYFLFIKKSRLQDAETGGSDGNYRIRQIKEKMKQCC